MTNVSSPLRGIRVVEFGDRIAVGGCGSVLAALGAEVILAEPPDHHGRDKWGTGNAARIGKQVLPTTDSRLAMHLAQADVVLLSSDVSGRPTTEHSRATNSPVVCDITAYGSTGPLAGRPDPDALVQAISGLADTTGEPDGPPLVCGFPAAEALAALLAVAGIIAALRERTASRSGQSVEIALYDCVFSTFAAFLPFPLAGESVTRAGNRHVLCSPWNVYDAQDGSLVICTATDEQWTGLCRVMNRPDLGADASLARGRDRVAQRERVDAAVAAWAATVARAEGATLLEAEGIPAGPIQPVDSLASEPNLVHRSLLTVASGQFIMPSAIRHFASDGATRANRAEIARPTPNALPLRGLIVLDMGQFTTAPLVARHLAALGATVLKIESASGDASRAWTPQRDGLSYFFALSNSDKQSVRLDLRDATDLARFRSLLTTSDVLVENLKPGSLARLGLSPDELAGLRPGLVYCAISGFGADSAYPGRPAFDTVVQAMSGMMDLTHYALAPQKVGISLADVLGGLFGLIGTIAALYARDTTGQGAQLDIAMHDAGAWITQWRPALVDAKDAAHVVRCCDGYAVVMGPLDAPSASLTRAALVEHLIAAGRRAAPVLTVGEVAASAQVRARSLLVETHDTAGSAWPAFASPIRMDRTPPQVRGAIGRLGEANGTLV